MIAIPRKGLMMRRQFLAAVVLFATSVVFGQSPLPPGFTQILDGSLSGDSYTNDSLRVIFHVPRGWAANLDAAHSVYFGKDPDAPANRCTHILLRFESPRKVKGWFSAWGIFFAIDPECLGVSSFPTAPETDNAQVDELANRIYQIYHPAPFFPPGTLDVSADRLEWPGGPVILYLRGKGFRNVDEIDPARKREPVPVSTEFVLTHGTTKYWVGWAAVADDHSRAELSKSKVQVKVP